MKRRAGIVLGLMLVCLTVKIPAQVSHDDSFDKKGLFKADVSKLKDTRLVAHPEVPLAANQNVLWCATLQLAWNEAIDLVGEKLHFVNQPPLVDALNQEDFTKDDLDPASYVAIADFERNHVEDEIRAALERVFHGAASPELIPPIPAHPAPDDFVAYAYLYKNLAFAQPFEDNEAFEFAGQKVQNFGFMENREKLPRDLFSQVTVCDYQSEDNFIIKLRTKAKDDELILAKVTPSATLAGTIYDVTRRIAQGVPEPASKRDQLAVPKINFDLRGSFPPLLGLRLQPSPAAKIQSPLVISEVKQLVRFQLNEKGAILKSEAVIAMATAIMEPVKPRTMIFDKPFLILMKRAKADQPYFALWVGNPTLLMSVGK